MKCKGDLREFLITGRKLPSGLDLSQSNFGWYPWLDCECGVSRTLSDPPVQISQSSRKTLNQTHHSTGFDFSHQTQSLLSHDSGTLYHTTRRSTRPLVKLSLSRRFKKSHQPSSRTSESGSDTTHDLDPTTCTVNTDPPTPLTPSPKLTETWVPDTEPDQDPSKSSV